MYDSLMQKERRGRKLGVNKENRIVSINREGGKSRGRSEDSRGSKLLKQIFIFFFEL